MERQKEGGSERRVFKRVAVTFFVTYKVLQPLVEGAEPQELFAQAVDISEGGMGLLFEIKPPTLTGQETHLALSFEITLRDGSAHAIAAKGAVRYCTQTFGQTGCRAGIQFIEIDEKDKELIAAFVASSFLS